MGISCAACCVSPFCLHSTHVYDLPRRRWDYLTEQGHSETIFDCQFKPSSCDILGTELHLLNTLANHLRVLRISATASFDQTVKIWDVSEMKAHAYPSYPALVLRASHACVQCVESLPGHEGVVYSIAWSPLNDDRLVAATAKAKIFLWDIGKGGRAVTSVRGPATLTPPQVNFSSVLRTTRMPSIA